MSLSRRQLLTSALAASVAGAAPVRAGSARAAAAETPSVLTLSPEYKSAVKTALDSKSDFWGAQLLARPEGPTYENIKDFLKPLMYAVQPVASGPQTLTGVYYLPFGVPEGLSGRGVIALHVADGSQIMTDRFNYRNSQFFVGDGTDRFGGDIARLQVPSLYRGYLPVLEVAYTDSRGVRFTHESFATYLPGTTQLASYVKITASGAGTALLRLYEYVGANGGLQASGDRLVMNDKSYVVFSPGATFDGTNLDYQLNLDQGEQTVYLVRITVAASIPDVTADAVGHEVALAATAQYWDRKLAQGAVVDVPEPLVRDATKGLLIQNLLATWRYSLGNAYEAFYQPESSDTVEHLGHFGFTDVYRSALVDLLPRTKGADRRNWEIGSKLTRAADYYRLTKDASLIHENEATYSAYIEDLIAQNNADPNRLLQKQQYSSDIPTGVYGLHQIGVAHWGVMVIAEAWRDLGRSDLADKYSAFADKLFAAYVGAARRSQVELPDGALFTPVELLSGTQPWDPITGSTLGGYFNLVVYYGFAARVYEPGRDEALRTLKYVYDYGSRFLGMLRARDSADDNVYEVEQLKFLADNDQADQIVLSFYGKLAHGMTRNTFVSGESHNIGPMATKWPACRGQAGCVPPGIDDGWAPGEYYRGMYLPPNTANNTTFLAALRLMVVRTVSDERGVPKGLQLGYSTPRGWLEHGKAIRVAGFPTEFGPLTYSVSSSIASHLVTAQVNIPSRDPLTSLSLRLRVPRGYAIANVHVNGNEWKAYDVDAETIDLSGLTGHITVTVLYRTVPPAIGAP